MLKNCLKPSRQHLHTVLRLVDGVHLLGSFDISSLFYSSTEAALKVETKEKANKKNGRRVPGSGKTELLGPEAYGIEFLHGFLDSGMKYQPFRSPASPRSFSMFDVFAPFSSSKILCADPAGHATVCDLESRTILGMPKLNSSKGPRCISVSIPPTVVHSSSHIAFPRDVDSVVFGQETYGYDRLYMLDMIPNSAFCFEVLAYYPELLQWCWRSLPAPPFDLKRESPEIPAYAVINGTRICLSSANATYLFDTVAEEWSKVGDWVLPFLSKAEYDPELGVWLGLSARSPYSLCTFDLSRIAALGSCDEPPAMLDIGLDIDPPEDWDLIKLCMTNLGSGRFCIAKFFSCYYEDDVYRPQDVIFTGVEVVPFVGRQGERTLRMIKHRSKYVTTSSIELLL